MRNARSSSSLEPLARVPFIGLVETVLSSILISRSGEADATDQPWSATCIHEAKGAGLVCVILRKVSQGVPSISPFHNLP